MGSLATQGAVLGCTAVLATESRRINGSVAILDKAEGAAPRMSVPLEKLGSASYIINVLRKKKDAAWSWGTPFRYLTRGFIPAWFHIRHAGSLTRVKTISPVEAAVQTFTLDQADDN